MKYLALATLGLTAFSAAALAQTAPANTSTTPPAISTSQGDSNTTAAPVAGANSFTESEARDRLEKHGYTDVTGLRQDGKSIWRGTATKNGKQVAIALDYQGNITAQ